MIEINKGLTARVVLCVGLAALVQGCSNQATGGDSLSQQKAGIMGAPAPSSMQAQIRAQAAQEQAAAQAHTQANNGQQNNVQPTAGGPATP